MRNVLISIFVLVWLVVFNYESTRAFFLEPAVGHPLPKVKFLFPPAGWIMFYNVDNHFGHAQVYGFKNGQPQAIDPHAVLQTRAIGYDNINRNALISVLSGEAVRPFCAYLHRKFPYFETFTVTYINYPSVTERPFERIESIAYECP